jgi:hypothetical protein
MNTNIVAMKVIELMEGKPFFRPGWDSMDDTSQQHVIDELTALLTEQSHGVKVTFEAQQAAIDMLTLQLSEKSDELGAAKESIVRWQAIVSDADKRANRRTLALLGLVMGWQDNGNEDRYQCACDLAEILHVDPKTGKSTL